jgi:hypothetical protein
VPVRLGVAATPRRSGAAAPRGTPPWIQPPPPPTAFGLRWDNRGARRRGSATTFGLSGRLVVTALVVAFQGWLFLNNPLMAPMALLVVAWALRDVWMPVRVIAPRPPARPQAPMGSSSWGGESP